MKQRPCSKPFLAFVLSTFMFIFAMIGSMSFSIGSGTLSGGLEGIAKSIGVDTVAKDAMISIMEQEGMDGFGEILKSEAGNALMDTVTDEFMGAFLNEGGKIDGSAIEEGIMNVVDSEINGFLDGYTDELKANPEMSAADSKVLKELADRYGFNLGAEVYEALDKQLIESGSAQSFKEDLKEVVDKEFVGAFKEEISEQMDDLEVQINKEVEDLHTNSGIDFSLFDKFEKLINIIKIVGIVLLVLAVIMFALQFLIYKKGPYGVFRNGAIVMFIVAIPLMAVSISSVIFKLVFVLEPVKEAMLDAKGAGIDLEFMMRELIETMVSPFRTLGIIYIILVFIFAVLAFILKANFRKKYPKTIG